MYSHTTFKDLERSLDLLFCFESSKSFFELWDVYDQKHQEQESLETITGN